MSPEACPQCGATKPADAALGLCPSCALKFGFDAGASDEQAAFSDAGEAEAPTESYHDGSGSPKRNIASEDLPQPGDRFGSYQLTRVLGRGGMGMVYEAEDTATSRRVALKLLTHGWDSPEARNRFFREGRLAASINHPHSVYIYGTEEIAGTPVISMEHIAGGTLQERVREHGALPPTEAVDAILDIIAGLEAAAAVGVLHRDVKPSNCFIDAEGTVKIGDFGLSMSTTSHSDSFLTVPGAYLGTPAFSSPEQLRGDVLDVRSDIYAVGVTLFYLLTGRTPFEGDNLVKLLATVLEQPAPSPASFREDLPRGLCKVVSRCLAKQPGDRYRDYAQLRAALAPFDSTAPTSAALALRFAAGVCDHFFLSTISTLFVAAIWGWVMWTPGGAQVARVVFAITLRLLYFAVPESRWGASLGKALFGLRVVIENGGRLGLWRAAARTAIYITAPSIPVWAHWIATGDPVPVPETITAHIGFAMLGVSYWVILAALFSTARRQNGFAAVHDLAAGARVVLAKTRRERPSVAVEPLALPDSVPGTRVGPYHILDTLRDKPGDEVLLGYDPRLLRRVWIHRIEAGSDPVSSRRRSVGRVGRLRWISGQRSSNEAWDAYDSFGGRSFLEVTQEPQPWDAVRAWLLDLATELAAARKDGTMPTELRIDHLWITADGRVKLLDFSAPRSDGDVAPPKPEEPAENSSNAGRFLQRVAVIALHGRSRAADSPKLSDVAMRLPVSANESLARFEKTDLPEIISELGPLNNSASRIARQRRAGIYAAMAAFPLLLASVSFFGLLSVRTLADIRPELNELRITLSSRQFIAMTKRQSSVGNRAKLDEAWEIYIADRFRDTIESKQTWEELLAFTISPQDRAYAERAVERHPNPTAQQVASATAIVEPELVPFLESQRHLNDSMQRSRLIEISLIQFTWLWAICVSIPALVTAICVRRGLIARAFGVEYVARRGHVASRYRLLWRAMLTQSPMFVLAASATFLPAFGIAVMWPVIVILGLLALLFVLPFRSRSVADRLAGTYPVPV